MRIILPALLVAASACAPKGAEVPTIPVPSTTHYACSSGLNVLREGAVLHVGTTQRKLGWSDAEGDHFVSWPLATTDMETTELMLPRDARKDAVARTYDTSGGVQRADWRLVKTDTCRAEGGYNDILLGFFGGKSIDELSKEYRVDREEVSSIVHDALLQGQRRYYKSH